MNVAHHGQRLVWQEYWSRLPFPSPGNIPRPGIEPLSSSTLALAGGFFTAEATWEAPSFYLTIMQLYISSVHGIFQASVLEWGATAFSDIHTYIHTYIYKYIYVYIPSLSSLPLLPPLPHPSKVVTEHQAEIPVLYSRFPLAIYFTLGSVYMSVLLSQFVGFPQGKGRLIGQ